MLIRPFNLKTLQMMISYVLNKLFLDIRLNYGDNFNDWRQKVKRNKLRRLEFYWKSYNENLDDISFTLYSMNQSVLINLMSKVLHLLLYNSLLLYIIF